MIENVRLLAVVVAVLSLIGCKGDDKDNQGGLSGLDEGQAYALKAGKADLEEVKAKLKKGEDTHISCAATLGFAEQLAGVDNADAKALLKEARQVCEYDAPLAAAAAEVDKVEKVRAAKPDENPLSECYNATYSMAIEGLNKKHPGDKKVAALEQRFAKACPK